MNAAMYADGLVLYVGLTPLQRISLFSGEAVQPDSSSQRFGLRTTPHAAIERAHYFMEWSPEGPKGEVRLGEVLAYKFRLTSYGYIRCVRMGSSCTRNHASIGGMGPFNAKFWMKRARRSTILRRLSASL